MPASHQPSDWTLHFLALPTELQLQILEIMLPATITWTEDSTTNSHTISTILQPMTFDDNLLDITQDVLYKRTHFRISQQNQLPFLELNCDPRERDDWRNPQPGAVSRVRNLVLSLSERENGRLPRLLGGWDPAQGRFQATVFADIVRHFPGLRRLEIDINPGHVRRVRHIDTGEYFDGAGTLIRDLYAGMEGLLHIETAPGCPVDPEIYIRMWNEGDFGEWESRRRAGTLRPAVSISAADFETMEEFVAEMLFLPHVIAVVRLRGQACFPLALPAPIMY